MSRLPLLVLLSYLLTVNVVAFLLFWFDKRRSKVNLWRISEQALLLVALLGGSLGAIIGQQVLHHKTRKQPFRSWLNMIVAVQLLMGIVFLNLAHRGSFISFMADLSPKA